MTSRVWFQRGVDGVRPYCVIPGNLISGKGVYYKSYPSGNMYNADSCTSDTDLTASDDSEQSTKYRSTLWDMIRYNGNNDVATIYNNNNEVLAPATILPYSGCWTASSTDTTLTYIGDIDEILSRILVDTNVGINYSTIKGNAIADNYVEGDMPIHKERYYSESISQLVGGAPGMYDEYDPIHYAVPLNNIDNLTYTENFDHIQRRITNYGLSTHSALNVNVVDTRATCFKAILSDFRNAVANASDTIYYSKEEIYAPYVLNQVGRTISITHAPDLCARSVINFGDNTTPVIIYTSGPDEVLGAWKLYDEHWRPGAFRNRPAQFTEASHIYAGVDNADAYLPRMRDYRGVHTYARDGEYTITIDTYIVTTTEDNYGSTSVAHVTSTHKVTIDSQQQRDIVYFKVPKEIDHMYFHGVRCILTDDSHDDYNVLALDVTGYDWVLGRILAGSTDSLIFDLPPLAETPYNEYKYDICFYDTNGELVTHIDGTLDYDAENNLFYKSCIDYEDDTSGAADEGNAYTVAIKLLGVREDTGDEVELHTYYGTQNYTYPYTIDGFFDQRITHLRFTDDTFTTMTEQVLRLGDCYRGWLPLLSLDAIQVAEFENDQLRLYKGHLDYIHAARGSYAGYDSDIYFESDYNHPYQFNMLLNATWPGVGAEYLEENDGVYTYTSYKSDYLGTGAGSGRNSSVILSRGCIGNTYDLRDVIPWKTYFPGCFYTGEPLELYE